ncbi:MAG: flagellar motor protein MotB [Dysgonamonadaceae bacterium]|jgi:outer membrane protein OmpA-like peptidoglycan-associated protein|nr:flagellar motor protein MotB [Dysgonamonadaceae bacterium]
MGKTNEKKRDFFWLSYSDLMTSLFFVMLVLFILVFSMQNKLIDDLKNSNETLIAAKEELERIKEIEKTVNNIDKSYFRYDSINKKHILNMSFLYPTGSNDITQIVPDKRSDLIKAGIAIKNLILKYPEEENIKYLVVIEGQASNDGWNGNDDLSYHRAQSLVNLWKSNNVGLDRLKNCEIIIAGSGVKGVPREYPDTPPANQRFLITIVPKIGEMRK